MGLAVPFLLTSLLMEQFLQFYSRFRSYMHAIEVASGGLMIALGVLLLIGRFTLISNWLSFLGKFEVWLEGAVINSTAIAILVGAVALAIVVYVGYRASQRSNEGVVMKRNPLALVVVAFVVALMLYFAYHQARRNGTASAPRITQSTVAPDFSLESLDGPTMRLSDLRGKAVLLNFWATWCGPCKIEMPWFVDLQKKYGSQGLQIVGVAMDDASKDDIAKFAKDMGVNYPILIGKEAVGDQYGGVPALPETFLIGRDGKIVDKIIGLRGKSEIEDSIKKALDTRPATSQASATEKGSVPQ